MKNRFFRQCRLRRQVENGFTETIGYIPSKAGKVGNLVQLVDLGKELWTVMEAGEDVPEDFVRENERNYKEFQGSTKGKSIEGNKNGR